MNFLQICQEVNTMCGMQGSMSTAYGATGYQATLAKAVINAWIDIQNLRREWRFMRKSVTFNTVTSQYEYTLTNIFGPGNPQDIALWVPGMVYYASGDANMPLYMYEYDAYKHYDIAAQSNSTPYVYAADPIDRHLYINPPDGIYSITAHYWRTPQILSANTDTPVLPVQFHRAIVYRAAADFAAFMGNVNEYQVYTQKADSMIGSIMRTEVPAKRVKPKGIC